MSTVDPTDDRDPETRARAWAIGERIRARMRQLGWLNSKREPDVGKLMEVMGLDRWQTVQFWVKGRESPSEQYAADVAKALDMTLDELMGLPPPAPPPGWQAFEGSELGRSMTSAESVALRSFTWADGEPDEAAWSQLLLLMRSRKRSA